MAVALAEERLHQFAADNTLPLGKRRTVHLIIYITLRALSDSVAGHRS